MLPVWPGGPPPKPASAGPRGYPAALPLRAYDDDGYPRPQLRRRDWRSLDGRWSFALDPEGTVRRPADVVWTDEIAVPFAPETPASGIGEEGFFIACWYRRTFDQAVRPGRRVVLWFEAVDHAAVVWVNGVRVGSHAGGYTRFGLDITEALDPSGPQEVVVRAEDDPHDLAKPRGKQDWQSTPHAIWYPRTSGIWQTVWLEEVDETHLASLRWGANLERWELELHAEIRGPAAEGAELDVELAANGRVLARDRYRVVHGEVIRRIAFSDPGIDDFRNELVWRPMSPTLIAATLVLRNPAGEVIDEVESYTALRSVGVSGDRFMLNGRPFPLRLVLDQGYWPETGATPADDAALRRDLELAHALGFNGVRRHQTIAPERFLYHADRLGLLVWEEMPSAYRFTGRSVRRLTREWAEIIERDISHPCIVAWVPFNESWGVPDLPLLAEQRHYVQALYHLTRTLDRSRPVLGNDGWESIATDLIGIHDYDDDPDRVKARYSSSLGIADLLARERPAGRVLTVEGHPHPMQPIVLSEFGGLALEPGPAGANWGYSLSGSAEELAERYDRLLAAVHASDLLAGFCYTQLTDTYQEVNGLLHADRTPKWDPERIARATIGPRRPLIEPPAPRP